VQRQEKDANEAEQGKLNILIPNFDFEGSRKREI